MSKTVAYQNKSEYYPVTYQMVTLTSLIVWTVEASRAQTGGAETEKGQKESAARAHKKMRSGKYTLPMLVLLRTRTDFTFIVTELPPHQPAASKSKPSKTAGHSASKPSKTAHSDASKPPRPRQKSSAARSSFPNAPPPHAPVHEETSIQNEKNGGVPSMPPPSNLPPTSRLRQKSPAARGSSPDLPSPRTAMREAVSARSAKKRDVLLMPPPSKPTVPSKATVMHNRVSHITYYHDTI